ncbi:shugoshin 1 [Echeneis naucrates]|uniref:Shugoshin C-terminal domain-containing protein n=1 Tax=Echeneis naucrates TaxID=173247 RepID=A0A665U7S2_ECHNA|nr:shugoshin 1 [Echeneis naucrates]
MGRDRAQKKSFQQSLEDIKERMKEKRNKRLDSASAPNRGRPRITSKTNGANSTHTILKGVQLNNKSLAVALQTEKEKVRQANAVILQLKREQQALFLHLLLLKRKLKEQEAATVSETKSTSVLAEPQDHVNLARRKRTVKCLDEPVVCNTSTVSEEPDPSEKRSQHECGKHVTLPSTVSVRRCHADKSSRRRSECIQDQRALSEGNHVAGFEAPMASPICNDDVNQKQTKQGKEPKIPEPIDTEEFQHSTPEPVQPKKNKQRHPKKKQTQQQPCTKPEPAARKPERGRRRECTQLKKPWENPKPRARSKSRDRSATRSKTAPPMQGNKLNISLGFNDTFDFDCEEKVHVTPFKAKAEGTHQATASTEEAPEKAQAEASPVTSKQDKSSSSSPSSDSDDSIYVPQRTGKKQTLPDRTKVITTRRGRPSDIVRQRENIPQKHEISVFRDEESNTNTTKTEREEAHHHQSPDSTFSNISDHVEMGQENYQAPHSRNMEDSLLNVSPLVEAEMMRIDNVLSNFGDSSCDPPAVLLHQTPQRIRTSKKRGLGVRTAGRGLSLCDVTNLSPAAYLKVSSDARCSTPVPARKRRCTMAVDYREPSINKKLRRGDRFTDLQFLRSPIFKHKSDRRSVQKSRKSVSSQQPFEKYNESFVGCR